MMSDAKRLREPSSERTTGFLSAYCTPNLAQQWTVAITPGVILKTINGDTRKTRQFWKSVVSSLFPWGKNPIDR